MAFILGIYGGNESKVRPSEYVKRPSGNPGHKRNNSSPTKHASLISKKKHYTIDPSVIPYNPSVRIRGDSLESSGHMSEDTINHFRARNFREASVSAVEGRVSMASKIRSDDSARKVSISTNPGRYL